MQTEKKAIELISQKFYSRIVAVQDTMRKSILDDKNGTLFTISNSHYTFRDQNGNFWLTIPENLIVNKKRYYPETGDIYTCNGINLSFSTKEKIVNMAADYFQNFIDPFYGFDVHQKLCFFYDEENGKKHQYRLVASKFKSCAHKKIKAFISFN